MNRFRHRDMEQHSQNQRTFSLSPSPLDGGGWGAAVQSRNLNAGLSSGTLAPDGEEEDRTGFDLPVSAGKSKKMPPPCSLRLCGETVLLLICLVIVTSCGYRPVGKGTHLPPGMNSLAIPTFVNHTLEPGIEVPFTQGFLKEFIRDRRLKIVDKNEADAILEGTIRSIFFRSVSYDEKGLVREYRTNVVVDLTLRGRGGEVIWRENNLSETRWFRTTSNVLLNESSKFNAIQDAAALVAERVRNRVFYNF